MNAESIISILCICVPIFAAIVGYIMHGLDKRISYLENGTDKLQEDKLDKEDYHRDQSIMRSSLIRIEDNVAALPEKIIGLLKVTGTIPYGKD